MEICRHFANCGFGRTSSPPAYRDDADLVVLLQGFLRFPEIPSYSGSAKISGLRETMRSLALAFASSHKFLGAGILLLSARLRKLPTPGGVSPEMCLASIGRIWANEAQSRSKQKHGTCFGYACGILLWRSLWGRSAKRGDRVFPYVCVWRARSFRDVEVKSGHQESSRGVVKSGLVDEAAEGRRDFDPRILHIKMCNLDTCSPNSDQAAAFPSRKNGAKGSPACPWR